MYPRQLWLFTVGCWTAMVAGVLHMGVHVLGPVAFGRVVVPVPGRGDGAPAGLVVALPGGIERSLGDLSSGFSLAAVVLLASLGAVGLIVVKRGFGDQALMLGVARALAVTGVALLGIAIAYLHVVPAMVLMLMTVCFALSSVRPPAPGE